MSRALLFSAACLIAIGAGGARTALAADEAPRKLRHLLRYVAADYRYAVHDGQVASRAEYEEQLLVLADAHRLATRLPREASAVQASIASSRALVEKRSPERDVVSALATAEALLVGAYRLQDRPERPPDLARGHALFAEHCTPCHGATGRGDTARARSLTPPPPDFHDAALGDAMSPLRAGGAIEFGIEGTSMVPFTFLSEQDRWNLAFVVAGLRHAGTARPSRAPVLSLPELAGATDGELLDHLYAAGAGEAELGRLLAAERTEPVDPAAGPLQGARDAWDEARRRWIWGDTALAREALLRGLHHGFEPARGRLVRTAPGAVLDIEQRAVAAIASLPAGAAGADSSGREAFPAAISALLLDTTRADLLASRMADSGPFARGVATAFAFLVHGGPSLLAAAAARGRRIDPRLTAGLSATAVLAAALWVGGSWWPVAVSGRGRLWAVTLTALATAVLSTLAAPKVARRQARGPALVLACAAAVAAGQLVHTAQLAGALPAHTVGPWTVLFPLVNATWEACCAQAACLLFGLAAVARASRPG